MHVGKAAANSERRLGENGSGTSQRANRAADVLGQRVPVAGDAGQFLWDGRLGGSGGIGANCGAFPSYGGEALDVVRQVVHADVRVNIHRQIDGAVTSEGLCVTGMHARPCQVGNERVSQRMEVHHAPFGILIFDMGSGQIDADHLGPMPMACPLARPDGLSRRLVREPVGKDRKVWSRS